MNPARPVRIAIALGSNLGDRTAHLQYAERRLRQVVSDLVVSEPIETDPIDVEPQPSFLNAAAVGDTPLPARALLDCLLAIERDCGRERPHPGAARTLDLDLILYGDAILAEPGLEVPHPRFRHRTFVLEPLAAIAPELVDPVTGKTVAELWRNLQGS